METTVNAGAGDQLVAEARAAFAADLKTSPAVTLRSANAMDNCERPLPFDSSLDRVTDAYLLNFRWGIGFLDPASWRAYLPHLIEHAVRHLEHGGDVTSALLESLRPPDRIPARLASLDDRQEAIVVALLDLLAFSGQSPCSEEALTALEEWWAPGALYRKDGPPVTPCLAPR